MTCELCKGTGSVQCQCNACKGTGNQPDSIVRVLVVPESGLLVATAALERSDTPYAELKNFFATEQFTSVAEAMAWWNEE